MRLTVNSNEIDGDLWDGLAHTGETTQTKLQSCSFYFIVKNVLPSHGSSFMYHLYHFGMNRITFATSLEEFPPGRVSLNRFSHASVE